MSGDTSPISSDHPLVSGDALERDELQRQGFASAAVAALDRVSATAGFVLSLEGRWGSGKTSTLAMIEQLLHRKGAAAPIVVHFNPWLIGERDALLRQFLIAIETTLELTDNAANAKSVAKELSNYSKVFDLAKWIPGAEPWATIIRGLMDSGSSAMAGFADQRGKDIEGQKLRLEKELRSMDKRILVIVDDIDRLFPNEAFEMVRIIKAVGQLPNIGYILAWDPEYVSSSLKSLSIPESDIYLDKIVQVRLPLPPLSSEAKLRLLNKAMQSLPPAALGSYFVNQDSRMQSLYFGGLRDLLEQPRDVARVVSTVSVMEPGLRGEIVFADILGMACLAVRAPRVYDEIRKNPDLFLGGSSSRDIGATDKQNQAKHREAMDEIFSKCGAPEGVRKLIHHMFPDVQRASGGFRGRTAIASEGHIASKSRLAVALQMGVSSWDVSLVDVRKFLVAPGSRGGIAAKLNVDNAYGFLELLGDLATTVSASEVTDLRELCIEIARLVDSPCYVRERSDAQIFSISAEDVGLRAIRAATHAINARQAGEVAHAIAVDYNSLTVAAQILRDGSTQDKQSTFVCGSPAKQLHAAGIFIRNVVAALDDGSFWTRYSPSRILWTVMHAAPRQASQVFAALRREDPSLDKFALHFLRHSFSSDGGQSYAVPKDSAAVEKLVKLSTLRAHAKRRLKDVGVDFPVRAAWLSVVERKAIYGRDGADARY